MGWQINTPISWSKVYPVVTVKWIHKWKNNFPIVLPSFTGDKNFALLRPAYQSSTFGSFHASKAVDGDNVTDNSFSATDEEYHPWWKVQLDTKIWVTSVEITNRKSQGMYEYNTCESKRCFINVYVFMYSYLMV